jgi:hypothetical protein
MIRSCWYLALRIHFLPRGDPMSAFHPKRTLKNHLKRSLFEAGCPRTNCLLPA